MSRIVSVAVPAETASYLEELVARLRALLGHELLGAYAGGSLALGGYAPPRSDVDLAVVSRGTLVREARLAVVAAVRHESLPCPARGLELVAYREATVRLATPAAGYELNLNTGPAMPFRVSLAPGDGEAEHWYAIDRAILREHGRTLFGPPPRRLFAELPRRTVLELLLESIRWHEREGAAASDDAVLNACRALRYAAEGVWSSKPEAARWARTHLVDGGLAAEAMAARAGGQRSLDPERVARFAAAARRSLEAAVGGAGGAPAP